MNGALPAASMMMMMMMIIIIIIIIIIMVIKKTIRMITTITKGPVHRCGAGGSMRVCQAAGPGSIPVRDKFPG